MGSLFLRSETATCWILPVTAPAPAPAPPSSAVESESRSMEEPGATVPGFQKAIFGEPDDRRDFCE